MVLKADLENTKCKGIHKMTKKGKGLLTESQNIINDQIKVNVYSHEIVERVIFFLPFVCLCPLVCQTVSE